MEKWNYTLDYKIHFKPCVWEHVFLVDITHGLRVDHRIIVCCVGLQENIITCVADFTAKLVWTFLQVTHYMVQYFIDHLQNKLLSFKIIISLTHLAILK